LNPQKNKRMYLRIVYIYTFACTFEKNLLELNYFYKKN